RRPDPGIAGVAAVAALRMPAIEIASAVRFDQVQHLVGWIGLRLTEAPAPLVDVPDEQPLARQLLVRSDAPAVLEQIVLLRIVAGGNAHDTRLALDGRQRDAAP